MENKGQACKQKCETTGVRLVIIPCAIDYKVVREGIEPAATPT
jgi:hypothetical protein